jgi:flagellar biosynthesis component FlhA/tetratricopeptide (TPR) repeat protein
MTEHSTATEIERLLQAAGPAMVRAGVEVNSARAILDEIENSLDQEAGWHDVWAAIDNKVAIAQPELQRNLIEFRSWFETELTATALNRIKEAFAKSADDGWREWVKTLAEAVSNFRFVLSARLCEPPFPFRESDRETSNQLRTCINYLGQGRWMEGYTYLDYLGSQEWLPAKVRARLLSMLGQIQLIHFDVQAAAKEFFDTAERLAPNDGVVLSAVGQYWIKSEKDENATACFTRAIEIAPQIPNAYCDLGEFYEGKGDLEKAKSLYEAAIKACPGNSLGYGKLMAFLGLPANLERHENDLLLLMKTGIIVSPEDEYQYYLDYGSIYDKSFQYEKSRASFQQAIDFDPSRPYGYVAMAQSHERENQFDAAKEIYRKIIEMMPDSVEGYLGLAILAHQAKEWSEALEWYQKTPRNVKNLAGTLDAKVAEMHARLKEYDKAEEIAKQVLRADKTNEAAKSVMQTIAGDFYRELNDRAEAIRVYNEMFDIIGDSYTADYHNLLGNLNYYFEDYQQAANEYRLALKAGDKPVFHRNLALACRQTKFYEEAEAELKKAFELDKDERTYNKERSLLLNTEGNDFFALGNYGKSIELYKAALACDATDDVIHSNLAGAWENLKEPGRAAVSIAEAIAAYQRANALKASEKYALAIEKLSAKVAFLQRYGESASGWVPIVTPIAVEVSSDLIPLVEGSDGASLSDQMTACLGKMKAGIQNEYGVKVPGVRFRGNETDLSPGMYVILLGEIPIVSGTCKNEGRFFPGSKSTLTAAGVEGEEVTNPATGKPGYWLSEDDAKKIEGADQELCGSADFIMRHLQSVLVRNLSDFVGHEEVYELITTEVPAAQEEMRRNRNKLTALVIVCHALLAEGVPITPFSTIYDQFAQLYANGATPQSIVESIRSLPAFRSRLPGNDPEFSLFVLSPQFESSLKSAVHTSKTCSVLAMAPETCQEALAAIRNAVTHDRNLIVVNDPDLRSLVRLLIEIEFPDIPVLSERELQTDSEFKAAQVIELEDSFENYESPIAREDSVRAENADSPGDDSPRLEPQITVQVNQHLLENQSAADTQGLQQIVSLMRDGLFYELGVMTPEVRVVANNALQPNQFRFRINGIESTVIEGLQPTQFLVNDSVTRLLLVGVTGTDTVNPANGNAAAVVENENNALQTCLKLGWTAWGPAGYLVLALSAEVRKNAASFQTPNITKYMVELLRPGFPDLFDTVLKRFTVPQLTVLFKNLLDEGISIRDVRAILEGLLSVTGTTDVDMSRYIVFLPQGQNLYPLPGGQGLQGLTMENYTDAVRMSLKKYISHKYTRGNSSLLVYLMDPQSEKRFADISRPLSDEEKVSFMDAVESEAKTAISKNAPILTSIEVRRAIRNALKERFFNMAVISYQELSPETNIQPQARISWIPEEEKSSETVAM